MQKKQQANESISQLANKFEKEIKTTPSQCATVLSKVGVLADLPEVINAEWS